MRHQISAASSTRESSAIDYRGEISGYSFPAPSAPGGISQHLSGYFKFESDFLSRIRFYSLFILNKMFFAIRGCCYREGVANPPLSRNCDARRLSSKR
jgi:hypothetical protein